MRLLFFITGLERGGAETQLTRLALAMKSRGWIIKVVSLLPKSGFAAQLEEKGVEVISLDMKRGRANVFHLLKAMRLTFKFKPHVIIGFMFHANILARLVGKACRVPVIITSIRTDWYGRKREWIEKLFSRWSDAVVFNSERTAEIFTQRGIVDPEKVEVIPNAIEFAGEKKRNRNCLHLKKILNISDDDFVWLAIGNLVPAKDYVNMIEAFRLVSDEKKSKLSVAGEGEQRNLLERMIREHGLEELVLLMGFVEDPRILLDVSHAFVLSSVNEGQPNALLEAMAAGKPVVATDVGGVSELIKDGVNGFLVEKNNPKVLALAMLRMMELSEEERASMAIAGLNVIQKKFDMSEVVRQWEAVCLRIYSQKVGKCWLREGRAS